MYQFLKTSLAEYQMLICKRSCMSCPCRVIVAVNPWFHASCSWMDFATRQAEKALEGVVFFDALEECFHLRLLFTCAQAFSESGASSCQISFLEGTLHPVLVHFEAE